MNNTETGKDWFANTDEQNQTEAAANAEQLAEDLLLPPELDVMSAFEDDIEPREFAFPSVPMADVSFISSPGGVGKSMLVMMIGASKACGYDLGGFFAAGKRAVIDEVNFEPSGYTPILETTAGTERDWHYMSDNPEGDKVLYISCEDGARDLRQRLNYIGRELNGCNPSGILKKRIHDNFKILPMPGMQTPFAFMSKGADGTWVHSAATKALINRYKEQGLKLIFIDTFATAMRGLSETSDVDMPQALAGLRLLAEETGAAVVFVHHATKQSARDGEGTDPNAFRGHSSIRDSARCQYVMQTMTQSQCDEYGVDADKRHLYIQMANPKHNYSARWKDVWLKKDERSPIVRVCKEDLSYDGIEHGLDEPAHPVKDEKKQSRSGGGKKRI